MTVPTHPLSNTDAGYTAVQLVPASAFHTINGLTFGPDGLLYVASVLGDSLFSFDVATGTVEVVVGPPLGHSDDMVFMPEGDLIWTTMADAVVRIRGKDGVVRDLAAGLPGTNSIALTRDGRRLFVGQVFLAEGLWEIDLTGAAPPRLVADDTGGLNAFEFGADGMIYAPSWARGQVVRVDPETGATEVLVDGLKNPGAVRFDADEQLYVLDDATGELFALDLADGRWRKRLIATLPTGTDNFAVGPGGRLYVSNMVDNSIHEVDPHGGGVRTLIAGALAFPCGIAISSGPEGERLHVADGCSYRTVDPATGAVTDVARAVETPVKLPTAVSVGPRHVVLTGEMFGAVQRYDHAGALVDEVGGLDRPSAAVEQADGSLVVAEPFAGRLLHIKEGQRREIVADLRRPSALADGGDGAVLVAESGTGRILRVSVADGTVAEVARGFDALRDVAPTPDGGIAALDVAGGVVVLLDARGGRTEIARGLPVGHLREPYPRSGGLTVGADGAIYVAADVENSIYRIARAG